MYLFFKFNLDDSLAFFLVKKLQSKELDKLKNAKLNLKIVNLFLQVNRKLVNNLEDTSEDTFNGPKHGR